MQDHRLLTGHLMTIWKIDIIYYPLNLMVPIVNSEKKRKKKSRPKCQILIRAVVWSELVVSNCKTIKGVYQMMVIAVIQPYYTWIRRRII